MAVALGGCETRPPGDAGRVEHVFGEQGLGNGQFEAPITVATALSPTSTVIAPFNDDNRLDIAVGHRDASIISILFGNDSGGYDIVNHLAGTGPRVLAAVDLESDADFDLVIRDNVAADGTARLSYRLGNGAGGE